MDAELSKLRRVNSGLRSVNLQRGKRIDELEACVSALRSDLSILLERCSSKSEELDALRVSYEELVHENLRLSSLLDMERKKSFWRRFLALIR